VTFGIAQAGRRRGMAVRARAGSVRQTHRWAPSDPAQARHGANAARSLPPHALQCRTPRAKRSPLRGRDLDGEALHRRHRCRNRARLPAGDGRLRVVGRLRHGPPRPRSARLPIVGGSSDMQRNNLASLWRLPFLVALKLPETPCENRYRCRTATQRHGAIRHSSTHPCAQRVRQRLGDARGLKDFGVNLMHLPPGIGQASAIGTATKTNSSTCSRVEVTLSEDGRRDRLARRRLRRLRQELRQRPSLDHNRMRWRSISKSARVHRPTSTICSDIDMMSTNADGRFVHKDGAPYP